MINALAHLQPTSEFRAEFAYDNLLYIVAGEVVARVSGKSWADFVTDEIFKPLGTQNCAADRSRIMPDANVTTSHQCPLGSTEPKPVDERLLLSDWVAPAGGIYRAAEDNMKWAQFWFDGGLTGSGDRLVGESQMSELWKGVTPIPLNAPLKHRDEVVHSVYALGWFEQDFQGTDMVTHSGGVSDGVSNFILLPKQEFAIFASTNDESWGSFAWTYQIADEFVDGRVTDHIRTCSDRSARTR